MQSKFHIGQKVICVNDVFSVRPEIKPVKGSVYTVRGIDLDSGIVGILLEEIRNKYYMYTNGVFGEMAFCENRFAPIENIKVEWSELAEKELILN